MSSELVNASFYHFFNPAACPSPDELSRLKESIAKFGVDFGSEHRDRIRGKVILAQEGINGSVSGYKNSIRELKVLLDKDLKRFFLDSEKESGIWFKENPTWRFDHSRWIVKIKKEIITLKSNLEIDMRDTAPHLDSKELLELFESAQDDFVLLDIRNDYEYELGHFDKSIRVDTRIFSEFTREELLNDLKEKTMGKKKIVTYCTGGVRCEKATVLMKKMGFQNLYQLNGGILGYGMNVGSKHWKGKCVVFDQRRAVEIDPNQQSDEIEKHTVLEKNDSIVNLPTCGICGLRLLDELESQCSSNSCNRRIFLACGKCLSRWNSCCSKSCLRSLELVKN